MINVNNSVLGFKIKHMAAVFFCSILFLSMPACSTVEKARTATDIVVANKKNFNLQALLQAETERQRLRKLRCHSPFLNPSAISGAAFHPGLGPEWVDELLRDCPEYAAFIAELVLQRSKHAGMARPRDPMESFK